MFFRIYKAYHLATYRSPDDDKACEALRYEGKVNVNVKWFLQLFTISFIISFSVIQLYAMYQCVIEHLWYSFECADWERIEKLHTACLLGSWMWANNGRKEKTGCTSRLITLIITSSPFFESTSLACPTSIQVYEKKRETCTASIWYKRHWIYKK